MLVVAPSWVTVGNLLTFSDKLQVPQSAWGRSIGVVGTQRAGRWRGQQGGDRLVLVEPQVSFSRASSIVISFPLVYMKSAFGNHESVHFLNLCLAQQIFIKGLFCDGACALDKQREKDRLSDPKSRPAGESEAGENVLA